MSRRDILSKAGCEPAREPEEITYFWHFRSKLLIYRNPNRLTALNKHQNGILRKFLGLYLARQRQSMYFQGHQRQKLEDADGYLICSWIRVSQNPDPDQGATRFSGNSVSEP